MEQAARDELIRQFFLLNEWNFWLNLATTLLVLIGMPAAVYLGWRQNRLKAEERDLIRMYFGRAARKSEEAVVRAEVAEAKTDQAMDVVRQVAADSGKHPRAVLPTDSVHGPGHRPEGGGE